MAIQIVFETHSTTEDNEKGVATGWLPGRLSATGREQAAALGWRRRHDGLASVFTFDLGRAGDTVDIGGEAVDACPRRRPSQRPAAIRANRSNSEM
jgi:broad specificity phosphatase PhoE